MKLKFKAIIFVVVCIIMSAVTPAQDRTRTPTVSERYVISAKAGGINFREGAVAVDHGNGRSGILLKGDQLEIGDRVSTGADGRAEILLNPGSYVRLGPDSYFEFKSTSLDDLRIRLDKGSAMFEVFATNDFRVSIFTPNGKAVLIDSGVYRVDVANDGTASIAVTEGQAEVGTVAKIIVKKGRTANIDGGPVAVAKFDRGKKDELAQWSQTRAKDLAKMTAGLRNDNVRNSLISSFNGGGWGFYDSFGLWVRDPFNHGFCFLPFGAGWYSPYGFGFGMSFYYFNLPIIRDPPTVGIHPHINPNQMDTPVTGGVRPVDPPYTKIGSGRETIRTSPGFDFPASGGDPVRVPSSSPVKVDMPMPAPVVVPVPQTKHPGN